MRINIRCLLAGVALLWLVAPAAAAEGDAEAGAKDFRLCAACHSLRPNVNMSGPTLAGVWGRKAGGLLSFPRYSAALAGAGVVWNEQTLDAWLADPAGFIPHNLMTIRGIADAKTRADLIALLRLAGPNGPTGVAATVPETVDPDLKTVRPPDRCARSAFAATPTASPPRTAARANIGSATCASKPTAARAARDPAHR